MRQCWAPSSGHACCSRRYLVENCADREYTLILDVHQVDALWEALKGPSEACLRCIRLGGDSRRSHRGPSVPCPPVSSRPLPLWAPWL